MLIEALNDRIVLHRSQRRHEQDGAHAMTTPADVPLAPQRPTVAVVGRYTGQGKQIWTPIN